MVAWAATLRFFAAVSVHIAAGLKRSDSDCETVLFDHIDADIHVRTMVVEDSVQQRSLILLNEADKSEPCQLKWWLEHNPQGLVQCQGSKALATLKPDNVCDAHQCQADALDVQLGYVRSMLASAVFTPLPHSMSAICIELGCRSKVKRVRMPGTLLETAPQVSWGPRPRPAKVLVIGLGSSTMAMWLRHQLPDTDLHVAELVPSVVAAAPCFGLSTKNDPLLHLHVADGRAFLQNSSNGEYDVILIDAFDSDAALPKCFRTRQFFEVAKQKLAPGGALSFNLLNNQLAPRVLKGLASNFETSRVWVGDAPGAVGIQNIITAFAPGHPVDTKTHHDKLDSATETWFSKASFRPLPKSAALAVNPFEDATECSTSRA